MKILTFIFVASLLSSSSFAAPEMRKCVKSCGEKKDLCLDTKDRVFKGETSSERNEARRVHRFNCREDYDICIEECAFANGKGHLYSN